jgi:anionic cell wall polymer biosynthesis LytR-Cps2A-Psr (LCP) family protein
VPHSSTRQKVQIRKAALLPTLKQNTKKRKFTFKRLFASIIVGTLLFVIFIAVWDAVMPAMPALKCSALATLLHVLTPTTLKGSDQGRVNVLIVGYSVDDPGHPGASLTDSIMLLSMSTTSHTGYMLSIPRDLYVKIPGFGSQVKLTKHTKTAAWSF